MPAEVEGRDVPGEREEKTMQNNHPVSSPSMEAAYLLEIKSYAGMGRIYATVNAPDLNAARARMAPLFPGCEIIAVEATPVTAAA